MRLNVRIANEIATLFNQYPGMLYAVKTTASAAIKIVVRTIPIVIIVT